MNTSDMKAAMREVSSLIGRTVKIDFVKAKIIGAQIQIVEGNPEIVFATEGEFYEFSPASMVSRFYYGGWYRKNEQERQSVYFEWEIE